MFSLRILQGAGFISSVLGAATPGFYAFYIMSAMVSSPIKVWNSPARPFWGSSLV